VRKQNVNIRTTHTLHSVLVHTVDISCLEARGYVKVVTALEHTILFFSIIMCKILFVVSSFWLKLVVYSEEAL